MNEMPKRKIISLPEELAKKLHEYAVKFHDGNDSAAIRYMIREGLAGAFNREEFDEDPVFQAMLERSRQGKNKQKLPPSALDL